MNQLQLHALTDDRRRAIAATVPSSRRIRTRAPRLGDTRHRLGVVLVEAGLHLIATADRSPRSLRLAR